MSTMPAFSPGPWITRGPAVGNFFKWTREDLYEQCSLHIAEKMPSSTRFGSRPRISRILAYFSSERLCSRTSSVVIAVMPPPSPCRERGHDRLEHPAAGVVAQKALGAAIRVGHEPHDVAFPVGDPSDVARGAVGVGGVR